MAARIPLSDFPEGAGGENPIQSDEFSSIFSTAAFSTLSDSPAQFGSAELTGATRTGDYDPRSKRAQKNVNCSLVS